MKTLILLLLYLIFDMNCKGQKLPTNFVRLKKVKTIYLKAIEIKVHDNKVAHKKNLLFENKLYFNHDSVIINYKFIFKGVDKLYLSNKRNNYYKKIGDTLFYKVINYNRFNKASNSTFTEKEIIKYKNGKFHSFTFNASNKLMYEKEIYYNANNYIDSAWLKEYGDSIDYKRGSSNYYEYSKKGHLLSNINYNLDHNFEKSFFEKDTFIFNKNNNTYTAFGIDYYAMNNLSDSINNSDNVIENEHPMDDKAIHNDANYSIYNIYGDLIKSVAKKRMKYYYVYKYNKKKSLLEIICYKFNYTFSEKWILAKRKNYTLLDEELPSNLDFLK